LISFIYPVLLHNIVDHLKHMIAVYQKPKKNNTFILVIGNILEYNNTSTMVTIL